MTRTRIVLGLSLAGLLVLGAACQKTSTTTTTNAGSTNTTPTTNQPSVTNSDGSFNTGDIDPNGNGQTVTVTITGDGVDEKRITVTAGTTVIFKNDDTISHQISSDPHPSHTDLPGFDRLIVPGAVYKFTFSKVGTWGYHDHLRGSDSSYQGTVTVQ